MKQNPRLEASAPDLLSALESSLEWMQAALAEEPEDFDNKNLKKEIKKAKVAISKAKGIR